MADDDLRRYAVVKYVYARDAEHARLKSKRARISEIYASEEREPLIGFAIPTTDEPWEDPEQCDGR